MRPFEEMSAWSVGEIESAIVTALPAGHRFQSGWDTEAGVWLTRFRQLDAEGNEQVLWEDWGPDRRILLFNALGWLMNETRPAPKASPWVRRREITREVNQQVAYRGAGAPDPGDLDPEEIQAVYGSAGQPK